MKLFEDKAVKLTDWSRSRGSRHMVRGLARIGVALSWFIMAAGVSSDEPAAERTIRVNAGDHGSVEPGLEITVPDGADAELKFRPDPGYRVYEILVDGEPVDVAEAYVFTGVKGDKTVEVRFGLEHVRELPFLETFMDENPGRYHMGHNVWYGDFVGQSAEILPETRRPLAHPRLAGGQRLAIDTHVMHIFGSSATLHFDEGDADKVWLDLRLRADLLSEANVNVEPETQMAFYINGDGKAVLYHRNVDRNRPVWSVLDDTNVENEEWLWVTILTDYGSIPYGGPYFQMYLNGVKVSHPMGRGGPADDAPAGGDWFAAVNAGQRSFNSLTVSGTGYLDEFGGDTRHPGFPDRTHRMTASVAPEGGGRITHPGESLVPRGWVKTYKLDPLPGHDIFDLVVDNRSVGQDQSHTFDNVSSDHTIEAIFAPLIEVRWEGNGEVTPGGDVLRRFGEHLVLDVQADEGHHIAAVSVRRGLEAVKEPVEETFGQGVTGFEYDWGVVREPGALFSVFAVDQHQLVVESEWGGALLNGQSVTPGAPVVLPWGSDIRLTIEHSPLELGDSRFTCRGWQGEGSIPAEGDTTDVGELVLKEDSSLVWKWTAEHRLRATAAGPGAAMPTAAGLDAQGQGWFAEDAMVEIRVAGADQRPAGFRRWRGDVPAGRDRDYPLIVRMDEPREIEAEFQ